MVILNNQVRSSSSGSTYNEGFYIILRGGTSSVADRLGAAYNVRNSEAYTDSNGFSFNSYGINVTALNSPPLNTWMHVAAVLKGNSAELYINGQLEASVSSTQNIQWSTSTSYYGRLNIGGMNHDGSGKYYPLDGSVDLARIFKRALTAQEVLELYTRGG